ncbi:MAG: SusC/RagA family TonB-linked outer membrane protein [Dysgonomonas sp.]|nr:SusC/RagA family TonB-linked outer membrane protein [Dysgonomonas sp.]
MKTRLFLTTVCVFMGISWAVAQNRTITGAVIYEEDSEPVIGASVQIPDTKIGTVTNFDGEFVLPDVPASAKVVRVSYVGMETIEVPITNKMQIKLRPNAEMLEEVVVIGYGSAKKLGSVVGSVATVGNQKIKNQPTSNFSDALQGQVSGLSVLSSSGEPSQTASIRLRGINSITAGTDPLFILDGAPVSSVVFSALNPSDIENITVLKDASSTAIYGSRAANGVIVITSKKGKMGEKAKVSFKAQYGISKLIDDKVDMMNSEQYFQFREMLDPSIINAEWNAHKKVVLENGISTDWADYIYRDNAPTYNLDATVTGGGNNNNYYISLNHNSMEGIAPLSAMNRTSLRTNIEVRANNWFKVGVNSNLSYAKYNENPDVTPGGGVTALNPAAFARFARPDDSPRYYTVGEDGKVIYGDRADYLHYSKKLNPMYVESYRDRDRQNISANINLFEEIRPLEGLVVRAAQALDAFDYTYSSNVPPIINFKTPMGDDVTINNGKGEARELFQRYHNFTLTNTAEYKLDVDNAHHATFLLGQEAILGKNKSFDVITKGHSDKRLMMLSNGTEYNAPVDAITETVFNSVFLRVDYSYKDKYYLDASYRVDGSSKFAPNHRWAEFYSVGMKWNIKKEQFMSQIKWLNDLGLRLSYGTTGNSSIGNYAYYGLVGGSNVVYEGENGISITQPSNPDLTWETVAGVNAGLDFRIFNRVSAGIEFYSKETSDMLMMIPYSYAGTGYGGGYGNIGAMTNKGFDIDVSVDIIKQNDIFWSFRANMNYNKNKITELFNGVDEYVIPNTATKLQVGRPYGEFYIVRRVGVDPRDGKQIWLDKAGNETKVYSEDNAVFIDKQQYAPITGGFGTSFAYKGLTVSSDFSFTLGKYIFNNDRLFFENPNQFGTTDNQSTSVLNMWTTPGQKTDIPAASEPIYGDSHFIENASFLRLKNLTISYAIPTKILKKTKLIESMNVFALGRNLFTVTQFTGFDPEPDSNLIQFNYPNTRQYMFGVEVTF